MAIYRFRVSFEDYDDITRDIDIKSNQTFEDLHYAIHKSTGYTPDKSSSFFVSTDQWIKGDEIAHLPNQRKVDRGVTLMEGTKLSRFIDDPHQKFYYIYNFDRPFDFHVELVKILDEVAGKEYPLISRSVGEAPKMMGLIPETPVASDDNDDDDDFTSDDTEYGFEEGETDEMETVSDLDDAEQDEEESSEDDEYLDEFSDSDDGEDYNNRNDY